MKGCLLMVVDRTRCNWCFLLAASVFSSRGKTGSRLLHGVKRRKVGGVDVAVAGNMEAVDMPLLMSFHLCGESV